MRLHNHPLLTQHLGVGLDTVVVTSADGGEGDVLVEAYEIY